MQPNQGEAQRGMPGGTSGAPADEARRDAVRRLEKKRVWKRSFLLYCLVNALLVGIWAVSGRGYFWPGWVLAGWGIAEVLGYWDAFRRTTISEADIDAELRRG
jgi:2TM domain